MSKVKIKTNLPHRFGKTVTIANHEILFDGAGSAEIELEILDAVKQSDPDLIITKMESEKEKAERLKKEAKLKEEKEAELRKQQQEEEKAEIEKQKQLEIEKQKQLEAEKERRDFLIEEYRKLNKGTEELDPDLSLEKMEEIYAKLFNEIEKQKQVYSKDLATKQMPNIQEIAKATGLPEEEWKSLKKLDLIKYLVEKAF